MSEPEHAPPLDWEPSPLLASLYEARDRQEIEEDRVLCERSFTHFVRGAWPTIKPDEPYRHNWHIDAVGEFLEAMSRAEILRGQIWVPPITMKTLLCNVMWPAWEWSTRPWLQFWTGSYEAGLSGFIASMSRDVMTGEWWLQRWGHLFGWLRDAEGLFKNTRGGYRLSTSPEAKGTGFHGHRIIIDDPINARAADATSKTRLDETNRWYDGTVNMRGIGDDHTRLIVMQRLHENDLAAHVQELEEWEVLCLPERYEPKHPFTWPDDPREDAGELIWPAMRGDKMSNTLAKTLGSRAAGQLQQRPAPEEGDKLKRAWWQFYDARIRAQEDWSKLPKFRLIVISIDCPQKDKQSNDNVAIQCWGIAGADRYLLDLFLDRANYNKAKRQITEMARWSRKIWRSSAHYILIENAGYGPEMIIDLKRVFTGVTKISQTNEGDKTIRAESASDALESGNTFVPGFGPPWQPAYDHTKTPADISAMIENFATFPNATHDDDVDAWSQCFNWLKKRAAGRMKGSSAANQSRGAGTSGPSRTRRRPASVR